MSNKLSIQVAYDKKSGGWGEAVGVMEEVMREYDYDVGSFELIAGKQDGFEVRIDGEVVCSGRAPRGGEDLIKL